MILCVDAGNTRIKYGLRAGDAWKYIGAVEVDTVEQIPATLPAQAGRAIIANVAGERIGQRLARALAPRVGAVHWVSACAEQCGVRNTYDDPQQLGADRWAALIGARNAHRGASVVVVAGTATTINLLDADGVFQGGLILPGLRMMRAALARDTAQLPFAAGAFQRLPRNTEDAIVSGAIEAQVGAIERMRARIRTSENPLCIVSGGASRALLEHLERPRRWIENLTLDGLAVIGRSLDDLPAS